MGREQKKVKRVLLTSHPELAAEWHPENNGNLIPEQVSSGSHKKVWWRCRVDPTHEWSAEIKSRVSGNGCPVCAGQLVIPTTSLQALYPELAAEWHPTMNGDLTSDRVRPGSERKVWWRCRTHSDHKWPSTIANRVKGSGCPLCARKQATLETSLLTLYPHLAAEWHPTKNETITPDAVLPGSGKKVWWHCSIDPSHEWPADIHSRVQGKGCPMCSGRNVTPTTSLHVLYPHLAAEWHPTKNGVLTPDAVKPGSNQSVWWRCSVDPSHEWQTQVSKRVRGNGCRKCRGQIATPKTSLRALYPNLAEEWHFTKNGELLPEQVRPGSGKTVWWQCAHDPSHEWQAVIHSRVSGRGCRYCNSGWTVSTVRAFVTSLREYLPTLTPTELYVLFQQSGVAAGADKSKTFVKALTTGRFPLNELDKFIDGQPSLVDQFIDGSFQTVEDLTAAGNKSQHGCERLSDIPDMENNILSDDRVDHLVNAANDGIDPLPIIETKDVLAAIPYLITSSADEEAIEFLVSSAVAKLWKHAFHDKSAAIAQAKQVNDNEYIERVRTQFLDEYSQAESLQIPSGYAFHDREGKCIEPNLMQRLIAIRVRNHKRVGNWSGTGAGKTLSALLASRVIEASLTIICCPNSVVGDNGWQQAILESFPKSLVEVKTFAPCWDTRGDGNLGFGLAGERERPRYLILNYEAFQQENSADQVKEFVQREQIDCIIVDEIHYAKQRTVENISQRRKLVAALIAKAAERNPHLHVLGMSATPVINNLQEGKSMIELVTGVTHNDLDIRATVANCMALHQRLVRLGIRWMPEYTTTCEEKPMEIDCSKFLDEIRALGQYGTPLALEQILTRVRLPLIRQYLAEVREKTLI